jgi:hypothetical protein
MRNRRSQSIALGNSQQQRIYKTFEDWEAEQRNDSRTPGERGIHVGSSVMWRHKQKGIIVTDRAIVLAISGDTLTLQVKDVRERTCSAHIQEIVTNETDRSVVVSTVTPINL